MLFKQTTVTVDPLTLPEPKQVLKWLWMIDQRSSPIVQAYGIKMIATYFESKETAEQFTK